MSGFLNSVWAMFTNNGMYSSMESVVIIVLSVIVTIIVMSCILRRARTEERANMIADLGYEGYLKHKERVKKIDIKATRSKT